MTNPVIVKTKDGRKTFVVDIGDIAESDLAILLSEIKKEFDNRRQGRIDHLQTTLGTI